MKGQVVDFDDYVGLGHVRSDSGEQYLFHCTQILDGSRTIATGTAVTFTTRQVITGAIEAFDLCSSLAPQSCARPYVAS